MGWYLRKSLKLGPIRFNLSKSGIGTSFGVRGLRIGSGPRGKYIHAGRGGLYFRQSLSSPDTTAAPDGATGIATAEDKAAAPVPQIAAPKDWLARTLRRMFLGR